MSAILFQTPGVRSFTVVEGARPPAAPGTTSDTFIAAGYIVFPTLM